MGRYLYDDQENCLITATLKNGIFTIPKEYWTPGLWAGSEGLVVFYEGNRYKVIKINLNNRQITVHYLGCGAV